eukprot:Pgem_evm1s5626
MKSKKINVAFDLTTEMTQIVALENNKRVKKPPEYLEYADLHFNISTEPKGVFSMTFAKDNQILDTSQLSMHSVDSTISGVINNFEPEYDYSLLL